MQRVLLGLLILVLVASGIGLFMVLQPGATEPRTAARSDTAAAAPQSPTPEPIALVEPESVGAAVAEERATAADAAVAAVEPQTARTEVQELAHLRGTLVLPEGLPADEILSVRVLAKAPPAGDPFPLIDDEDATHSKDLLGELTPDASGGFELRVPLDKQTVWIELDAKYLFLEQAVSVDLVAETTVELRPRLGAWISGRVIVPQDATAEELEGVGEGLKLRPDAMRGSGAMGVRISDRRLRQSTAADDDLRFEFTGVNTSRVYNLSTRPKRLTAVKSEDLDLQPGQHLVLDLTLTRGARVSGRVVDAAGLPVAEAELELSQDPLMFGQGGFEVREGESAEDGSFDLLGIRPGSTRVTISGDGFIESSAQLELAEGQHLTDQVFTLDVGNSVSGRVLWNDRTPVANVDVDLRFDLAFIGGMEAFNAMKGAEGESKTDAEGRFTITGLGNGPFTVISTAEQREDLAEGLSGTRPEWQGRADKVRPGDEVELILTPPVGIAGRVVNDLGEPIDEFRVMARTDTGGMLGGLGSETASGSFEDDDGSFLLEGLRDGDWLVEASAEGFGVPDPVSLTVPQLEGEVLELMLPRAASVSGIVLSPTGEPLPWATVSPKFALADIGRMAARGRAAEAATCDEEGKFLLEGLTPGSIQLVAHSEQFADSDPVSIEAEAAQRVEDVVLTLRIGGRILGLVLDEEGKPSAGRTIIAQVPTDPGNQRFANSDLNGEFVIESLTPGTYQVMTFGGGADGDSPGEVEEDNFAQFMSGMQLSMAEVVDGEDTHVTLGSAVGDPVAISGRVVSAGKPVSGVLVSFFNDGEGALTGMKFATSKGDGSFEVKLDHPGRYLVNVQKIAGTGLQQNVEFSRTVPEVERHELTLELPIAGISGTVYAPDRKPAAGARISLSVDGPIRSGSFTGGNYAEIETDEQGNYELLWLRPGTYSVAAGGPSMMAMFGGAATGPGRQVRTGLKVREGQRLEGVDFRLEEPGTLKGQVVDLAGRPVAEAAIFLRDGDGNALDRFSFVQTDSGGRFKYPGLTPGGYEVRARGAGLVSATGASARVRSGEDSEVQLTVDAGTVLIVTLSDKQGNPIECSVQVLDSDGNQVNGMWSMSELMAAFSAGGFSSLEQKVGPLPPGKYRVLATNAAGLSANKPVTLRSSMATRKLNLRLD